MRLEVPVLPKASGTTGAALDLRGRSGYGAPDRKIMGGPELASAPQEDRDAVRTSQTHSQARPLRTTRSQPSACPVHPSSYRAEPSKDGQADPDARGEPRITDSKRLDRITA